MSSTIWVVAKLTTAGANVRPKVVEALKKVANNAQEHEPATLKFAITIPESSKDKKSIYVLEEYLDQAAIDTHMASPVTAAVMKSLEADSTLLEGRTEFIISQGIPELAFTRDKLAEVSEPAVIFATIEYLPGTRSDALNDWKETVAATKASENGTLSYALTSDKKNPNLIRAIETYESKEYVINVHAKGASLAATSKKHKDIRKGAQIVFCKKVGGYFHREKSPAKAGL